MNIFIPFVSTGYTDKSFERNRIPRFLEPNTEFPDRIANQGTGIILEQNI